jgi:antitoxin (DNA-binding transcriptional repressor) of toxin-antitoxin stability system
MSLFRSKPLLKFLCTAADNGVIAPPFPAKAYLPEWFRKLPAVDDTKLAMNDTGLTIKRCMPFLDAMTTGWIIPLAATVRMEIRENGAVMEAGWDFDRTMVSNHAMHQVKSNPWGHRPPRKFHNYWTILTPPGWSCLFINPLNRPNGLFEIVAGIVDTDTYPAVINFPFFATGPDGLHVLEKGTPVAQVIPFRRDVTEVETEIRAETKAEAEERVRTERKVMSGTGWYRTDARAKR